ncbi:terpenoid synthase [Byssothecium circinans]|uniref:Terpenoid synthase n=1 Tax=Byssothecium circinans TaxID=147558 RepID=A0A6A5U4X3_9PLEO|nr:terpenoid synthase [Byssothecium circinans]
MKFRSPSGEPLLRIRYADSSTSILDIVQNSDDLVFQKTFLARSHIRIAIKSFLDRCDLVLPAIHKFANFTAHCMSEAVSRGYITPKNNVFGRFIPAGVCMAQNAYGHQPSHIQRYICFYTAFLVYLDDMFGNNIDAVQQFNHRFLTRQPQATDLLGHFANSLLEMPTLFGAIAGNLMTTSTLNLVTALLVENEFKDIKLEDLAYRFPTFSRVMSGASETYALFIFPVGQPVPHFLQALPDLMVFINNGNDILSFYKEQLAKETVNRVYLTAQCRSVSQAVILQELIDEAAEAHKRILRILEPHKSVYESYIAFSQGYIGFHFGLDRYKLRELDLHTQDCF